MNNKGYTLVELLAVIVIIALLGGIATISYISYQNTSAERVFETYMDSMHESAIMYYLEHGNEKPISTGDVKTLYLSNLPIDKFNNPYEAGDYCVNSDSYVSVEYLKAVNDKGTSGLKYHVCLKCNRFNKCKDYTN